MESELKMKRFFLRISGDGVFKNAAVLSLAGIVAKVIGAIYRVPLAALLKSEGLGIYQLVFPLYCVLLTFSSTGVPSGISKLVADGAERKSLQKKAFLLFGFFGLVGSLTMFSFAGQIARAQGEAEAAWAYRALSPSVALVSIISVVRGVFQGKADMVPTAVSQVTEQVVKAAASLALGFLFGKTAAEKAAFATLGVTLSEAVALIYLLVKLNKKPEKAENGAVERSDGVIKCETINDGTIIEKTMNTEQKASFVVSYRALLTGVFAVTLSAVAVPLIRTADSFLAVNLLDCDNATALFGLYSGGAESVTSLPVAVCYALAASAIPALSGKSGEEKFTLSSKIFNATFFVSSFSALALVLSAPLVVKILFSSLSAEDSFVLTNLLRVSAPNIVLLSLIQSFSAYFISKTQAARSGVNLILAIPVKVAVLFLTLKNPRIGVYGCAFSDTACFFVAAFLDLVYIIKDKDNMRFCERGKDETC